MPKHAKQSSAEAMCEQRCSTPANTMLATSTMEYKEPSIAQLPLPGPWGLRHTKEHRSSCKVAFVHTVGYLLPQNLHTKTGSSDCLH